MGWGWLDAVHEEDQDQIADVIGAAYELQSDFQLDYRVRVCNGQYQQMRLHAAPVLNTDGSLRSWIGVHCHLV